MTSPLRVPAAIVIGEDFFASEMHFELVGKS